MSTEGNGGTPPVVPISALSVLARDGVECQRAREFYQALFENAGAVVVYDLQDERVAACNARFVALTGYNLDEWQQLRIEDVDIVHDAAAVAARIAEVQEHGTVQFETKIRTKAGLIRDVEVTGACLEIEGRVVLQGVYFDITSRKDNARELGRQNHQLQLAQASLERALRDKTRAEQDAQHQRRIVDAVSRIQGLFITDAKSSDVFDAMLLELLRLTESQYGFVDSLEHEADGTPYLQALAISNIAWDAESRAFYEQMAPGGMRFYDFGALFGPAVTKGEIVLSNFEPDDPRRKGTPNGHPPIETFLAMPLFHAGDVIGVIGLANREQGYGMQMAKALTPVWLSCAQLVNAQRVKRALQQRNDRIEQTLAGTGAGTWLHDVANGTVYVDERTRQIVGLNDEVVPIEAWLGRVHAGDLGTVQRAIEDGFGNEADRIALSYRLERDGQIRHIKVDTSVTYGPNGPSQVHGLAQDVTDFLEAKELAALSERRYQRLVEKLGDNFVVYSHTADTGIVRFVSPGFESVFGMPNSDILGRSFREIDWGPAMLGQADAAIGRLVLGTTSYEHLEYSFTRPAGDVHHVFIACHLAHEADGTPVIEGLVEDITDKKVMEQQLIDAATHDPLTRVLNRRAILNLLDKQLEHMSRYGGEVSVLMLDLDHFKRVNDTHGHLVGDAVLRAFAAQCAGAVRAVDSVGRYGGEEFIIVLPETGPAAAVECAERVQQAIGKLAVDAEDVTVTITASVGVSSSNERDVTAQSLLARADLALYAAKSNGRNRIELG